MNPELVRCSCGATIHKGDGHFCADQMQGYYLEEYSIFSVRYYKGQWCCFCRMPYDVPAEQPEHVAAILMWAAANREKFRSASND